MSNDHDAWIDAYLHGTLSVEELREVERLIREDEGFRQELKFRQQLQSAMRAERHQQLKEKLAGFSEKATKPPGALKKTTRVWWYAAAILLAGIVISIWLLRPVEQQPGELFAAYFSPYPNIAEPITRSAGDETLRKAAYGAYERSEFETARARFADLMERAEPDPLIPFYSAIASLACDKPQEAVILLQNERLSQKKQIARQVQWYQALAYLKLEQDADVVKLLESLVASPGFKQEEAGVLLKKVKASGLR